MGLWGKIRRAVGGNTGKGALIGSMIDPIGGAFVGGAAGKHKKNHSAAGPATRQAMPNFRHAAVPSARDNPYNSPQSLKGTPPQAQGPATSMSSMQGKGTPPTTSPPTSPPAFLRGGGGPMQQQAAAPMKGR